MSFKKPLQKEEEVESELSRGIWSWVAAIMLVFGIYIIVDAVPKAVFKHLDEVSSVTSTK